MKAASTYKGMRLYSFRRIPHRTRKDVKKCHGFCVKLFNGRYYMSLNNYIQGRKSYWRSCFRRAIHRVIREKQYRKKTWQRLAKQIIQNERISRLLHTLKRLSFEKVVLLSQFYTEIQRNVCERRKCNRCGSLDTVLQTDMCKCHL